MRSAIRGKILSSTLEYPVARLPCPTANKSGLLRLRLTAVLGSTIHLQIAP
jgi:hypothetical protein